MAFIGTPLDTRNTFQSLAGKRFNGDGSETDFTLDVAPSSTLDIEVFVGNVRQDPNSAYTLSGTTLTFTGAPPSGTNNIYVVHQAKAVGTIEVPSSYKSDSQNISGARTFTGGVGVGAAKDLGTGLHIRTADSGASVDANADELVVEGSANSGISILSGASNVGGLVFGDSGDNNIGMIEYNHSNNKLQFTAGGETIATWTSAEVCFNEDSSANNFRIETDDVTHMLFVKGNNVALNDDATDATRGLGINQGDGDSNILTLKSSDVAHGITNEIQTDTFGTFLKRAGATGGLHIKGFCEDVIGLQLQGYVTTADSDKNSSANGAVVIRANIKSGVDAAVMTSNGNLLAVQNGGNNRFIVDAEGDTHSDGSASTYDAYEDAQLVRAFDLSHGNGVINSKFDKFVSYNHEHLADLKLVGREKDGTPNHMINNTGMMRLHNGAIWQQYEKHNQLLDAVYELAKEAVGEEKANAILDKHEVKRLN